MNLNWMNHAACRGMDTNLFFPEVGGVGNGNDKAISVCENCPVITHCRAYADHMERRPGHQGHHGVWGGTTPDERDRSRRKRQPARCGTNGGYKRHRRLGEDACGPCLAAHSKHTQKYEKAA